MRTPGLRAFLPLVLIGHCGPARAVEARPPGVSISPRGRTPDPPSPGGHAGHLEALEVARADSAPAPTNRELARRLDLLAREIDELEQGAVSGAPESHHGLGPAASKVYAAERGVSIGGYGEMLYAGFEDRRQDHRPSGAASQIDFLRQIVYVGYKYSDRILFNSEIELEHATTEKGGSVSVEFAYVDGLLHPAFNLRGGLLLVPVGFLNELHEPPVFLGAHRPGTEQRILPSTWSANGAGIFGQAAHGLSYRAFLIESLRSVKSEDGRTEGFDGSGLREGRQAGSESRFENVAGVARVEYERSGVLVGGSLFHGGTSQGATRPGGAGFDARTTIYEAHVQVRRRGVRIRALLAGASIDDAAEVNLANGLPPGATSGVGSRLRGWYAEAGYDLLARLAPASSLGLTPYARFESLNTQREVPAQYRADWENDLDITTVGLAFYPHPQVVVKADFEIHRNEARTGTNQWNLALGYLF